MRGLGYLPVRESLSECAGRNSRRVGVCVRWYGKELRKWALLWIGCSEKAGNPSFGYPTYILHIGRSPLCKGVWSEAMLSQWVLCPELQMSIKRNRVGCSRAETLFIDQGMEEGERVLYKHLLPDGRGVREF